MATLLIANLDCERAWAGLPAHESPLRERLSALGALMAVLAAPGDALWTRAPVDAARIAPALDGCGASFVSGALPASADEPAVAWGATDEVVHLTRVRSSARAGDRRTQLEWATARGCALPGARTIRDESELHRHLDADGAAASATGHWVVKAPHGTAGRARLRGSGLRLRDQDRPRFERLVAAHGILVFEPWMDVVAEFGVEAHIESGGVCIDGVHRQTLRGGGAVSAIEPLPSDPQAHAVLLDGAAWVGEKLLGLGYSGPFGVDSYRHRDAAGSLQLHPVGEINARVTFGRIARAAVDRLGAPGMSLHLGDENGSRPRDCVPLVLPAPPDGVGAWLAK